MSKLQEQQPASEQAERATFADRTPAVTFRDKAFKSRVIVFPGNVVAQVERGTVTVSERAQIDALTKRDDFERVSE